MFIKETIYIVKERKNSFFSFFIFLIILIIFTLVNLKNKSIDPKNTSPVITEKQNDSFIDNKEKNFNLDSFNKNFIKNSNKNSNFETYNDIEEHINKIKTDNRILNINIEGLNKFNFILKTSIGDKAMNGYANRIYKISKNDTIEVNYYIGEQKIKTIQK